MLIMRDRLNSIPFHLEQKFYVWQQTEMMGAGGKSIEEELPKPASKASEANVPQIALEFNNVQIKFCIVQPNEPISDTYELFPTLDPSAPSNR